VRSQRILRPLVLSVLLLAAPPTHGQAPEIRAVEGNQNFWHLGAQDVQLGRITMSTRRIVEAGDDGLTLVPNSVWGTFTYRLRLDEGAEPATDAAGSVPTRPYVPSRSVHLADVGRLTDEQTLGLSGWLLKIAPDRRTLEGRFTFADGELACTLELIEAEPKGPEPQPTLRNVPYGPHWRHAIDFYRAESDHPTPLLVHIHGGGWGALDKSNVWNLSRFLESGISVASINYRFVGEAMDHGVEPPVKWPLGDAARAIQVLRTKSEEWNSDPGRIGAQGGSAGACTSLWLAMHDDMADPGSPDPVARQSTRLACAGVVGAQTSLDPHQMRAWMPNVTYGGHAFGFRNRKDKAAAFQEFYESRPQILPWIRKYSPYEHASADDPPIYLDYPRQEDPVEPGTPQKDPTHSAIFGLKLAERLKEVGAEVYLNYPARPCREYPSQVEFMIRKLTEE
jgi:acetyl esterase/lipase